MNINIPDKVYKLLIMIGLLSIGYGIYNTEKSENKYFSKIDQHRKLEDSISISELRIENDKNKIINTSRVLSKTYDVENPIKSGDTSLSFVRVLTGSKNDLIVSDSVQKLWMDYLDSKFRLKLLSKKQSFSNQYLKEESQLKETYTNNYIELRNIGFILFFVGLMLWVADDQNDSFQTKKIKQHEKIYSHCQSCGKDFSSMRVYGINKDQSLNYAFCSECYENGSFTNPELSSEEFSRNYLELLEDKHWITKIIGKIRLSNLERWR